MQELADGTPFTFTGARTLLRYGIMVAVVPLASVMAADVTYNVINEMYDVVADMHLDNYASPEVGLVIILVSLLCRYGAEVMQRQNA